jgi:hypothetical protein
MRNKPFLSHIPRVILGVLFIIVATGLFSFHDFFHNHEHDGEEHHDCPVFHFRALLTTVIVAVFLLVTVDFVFQHYIRLSVQCLLKTHINDSKSIRAPPSELM